MNNKNQLFEALPEAEVCADEGEWDGDPEPERQQRHQREERDRGRAPVVPQNLNRQNIRYSITL